MSNSDLQFSGQIKLAELSVFNWGSFDGLHHARVDPQGTLITGDNGSGKSTLIDGLMALLLPAGKAVFNVAAAQGDRSDRSLMSYMRGSYGSDHDGARTRVINKREGPTHTALRALYRGDDGSQIVLAALFWTTQASTSLSDVHRLYVLARYDFTLRELLNTFADGNVRRLKQMLRDNAGLQFFDGGFDQYRESYQRALYIENRNAPELLARALGLKKIDDLTQLIRTLVLEPSRVRDDARKAVAEFDDLRAIHNEMSDARAQVEALQDLLDITSSIGEMQRQASVLDEEIATLGDFYARQAKRLWQARTDADEASLREVFARQQQLESQEAGAQLEERDRYADYREAGGDRIELLRRELGAAQDHLTRVVQNAGEYQRVAKQLGLSDLLQASAFQANLAISQQHITESNGQRQLVQDNFGVAASALSALAGEQQALNDEIKDVKARPDSNIGPQFQRLRDELTAALNIDKQLLPFVGELIDVADDQREWQGAIERALGGLRTTLLVPADELARITGWVNRRHMGMHVRLQVVKEVAGNAQFKNNGFLRKLQWQQHPYREWLKHHLARFDLDCVDDAKQLRSAQHAMTREGLVQHDKGRFEKKDQQRIDDRRHWALGFSNRSRLALLQKEKKELAQRMEQAQKAVTRARERLDQFEQHHRLWQRLGQFAWPEIDLPEANDRAERLKVDLQAIEQGAATLQAAEQRWQQAQQRLKHIQQQLQACLKNRWQLEASIEQAQVAITACDRRINDQAEPSVLERLQASIGQLEADELPRIDELEREKTADLNRERQQLESARSNRIARAIGVISRFRARWPVIAVDWGDKELAHCQDYLEHLQTLQQEGLPQLVEKFAQRLNLHTTQSLANLREKIESERDEIRDRIEVINSVLLRTEFKSGSYLRLRTRRETHAHVTDMEQRLKTLLSRAASSEHEARFQQLQAVIEVLDKASHPASAHTQESRRLLDPRYQMNFFAEEVDSQSGEIRDVLESSSGKSGGEKEAFAGTVVAASLAYVLTPVGRESPVYCTVFLDEAFSNTAEAVSRRVLKIFQELKIHINLITPYKNLNLARESARSLLIAERDAARHESRLCEVTWEEIDAQRRQLQGTKELETRQQATELGIVIEP